MPDTRDYITIGTGEGTLSRADLSRIARKLGREAVIQRPNVVDADEIRRLLVGFDDLKPLLALAWDDERFASFLSAVTLARPNEEGFDFILVFNGDVWMAEVKTGSRAKKLFEPLSNIQITNVFLSRDDVRQQLDAAWNLPGGRFPILAYWRDNVIEFLNRYTLAEQKFAGTVLR